MTSANLTKLGGLEPKIAGAACYLPVMYIHLIASIAFLVTEPKENRPVRFHAVQSLLLSAVWLGSTIVLLGLMIVLPILFIILGGMVGGDLADLMVLLGILSQMGFGLLAILAALAGPLGLFVCAALVAMGGEGRVPVVAGLADRFA